MSVKQRLRETVDEADAIIDGALVEGIGAQDATSGGPSRRSGFDATRAVKPCASRSSGTASRHHPSFAPPGERPSGRSGNHRGGSGDSDELRRQRLEATEGCRAVAGIAAQVVTVDESVATGARDSPDGEIAGQACDRGVDNPRASIPPVSQNRSSARRYADHQNVIGAERWWIGQVPLLARLAAVRTGAGSTTESSANSPRQRQ